ncbi:hypothetical protein [Candidatus Odyssella thessalonicensis]|uniref:hypothetical protein n=1 Tax=Candidatus Odyssella thessalonicensis TaxID=84647 RepID=UPI000225B212|nr:hypothetical protein [Candidatus Odyssella thessalonicensis]
MKPEEERLFDNLKKFRKGAVIQDLQKRLQPEEKFLFDNLKNFKKEAVTEQLKNQLKAEEELLLTNLNKFEAEAVSSSTRASQVAQHKTKQSTTDKKRPLLVKQKGTLHIRKYLPEASQEMLSLSENPEAVFEVSQEAFYPKDITKDKKKFLSWLKNSNLFEVS